MTTSSGAASHPTEVENVFGLDLQLFRERLSESARDNPERYYGWFWVYCSSKKFERMARDVCDVMFAIAKGKQQK